MGGSPRGARNPIGATASPRRHPTSRHDIAFDGRVLIMIMIFTIDLKGGLMRQRYLIAGVFAALCVLGVRGARADDSVFTIEMVKGLFQPPELVVPADHPFQVHVTNRDAAAIEFESFELHRERVVQPGETITVYVPALSAGRYPFFDDFHSETPHGAIIAK
jgi:heme/copper-type cytochrome/quinol oxidase subunit 2